MKAKSEYPRLELSIGILSWNNRIILENSLKSYQRKGLLDLSDDITVLFQECSEEDKILSEKYGINYIPLETNIGIGFGIGKLAENAKYENFLFLEHDWKLIENKEETYFQIKQGIDMITNDGFDVIRFRHRKKPGVPLISKKKYFGNELNYFDEWHQVTSPHLLETMHWLDPAVEFPDKIQKKGNFFTTTSRWANWTNNPFLINKNFFISQIAPFAGEKVSFEKNIAKWWVTQNFEIAQGEGLFTHDDFIKYPKKSVLLRLKQKIKKLLNL